MATEKQNEKIPIYIEDQQIDLKADNENSYIYVLNLHNEEDPWMTFKLTYMGEPLILERTKYEFKKLNDESHQYEPTSQMCMDDLGNAKVCESGEYQVNLCVDEEIENIFYIFIQDPISFLTIEPLLQTVEVCKRYDGNPNMEFCVEIPLKQIEDLQVYNVDEDELIKVNLKGDVESENVGKYDYVKHLSVKSVSIGEVKTNIMIDLEWERSYSIKELEILKRPVYIGTRSMEDIQNTNMDCTKTIVERQGYTGYAIDCSEDENEGFLERERDFLISKISVTVKDDFYYEDGNQTINRHSIIPILDDLDEIFLNYELHYANTEKMGDLFVENMILDFENIKRYVKFITQEEKDYDDYEKFFVGANKVTLKAMVEENEYFDEVCFLTGPYLDENNLSDYYMKEYNRSGEERVSFCLKNKGSICTKVGQFVFYADVDHPTVKFEDEEVQESILGAIAERITFGLFKNKKYNLWINVSDSISNEISYSGIKNISYTLLKLDNRAFIDTESIKNMYASGNLSMKNVEIEDNKNKVSFPISVNEEKGYYMALIFVEDHVGNQALYGSNGMVIDLNEPQVSISDMDSEDFSFKATPYTSDVHYRIDTNDLSKVISGINDYRIEIFDGNKKIYEKERKLTIDKKDYAYEELENLSDDFYGTIDADIYESNNLKIKVTARDQAGNEKTKTQSLMIDTTPPKIYTKVISSAKVKNGKYYNGKVTIIIEYIEKNFTEKGLTFDVFTEEDTYLGITLDQLKRLNYVENDEEKSLFTIDTLKDTQSDRSVVEYTNDRKIILSITANKEDSYRIVPHICDQGGLKNEEKTEEIQQSFVYDVTPPQIDYVLFQGIHPGENEASRAYASKPVSAFIQITEKNFKLESSFGDEQWDTSEEKEQADIIKDAKKWFQTKNTYINDSILFQKDDHYTFGFTYTDLAGNTAVYNPVYFTIDTTKPEAEINVDAYQWKVFLEKITFGIFKNRDYKVEIHADDETSGIKSVEYIVSDEVKTLDALEKENEWQVFRPFSIKPEKQCIIYSKICDRAGNIKYVSSDGIIADSMKPLLHIERLTPSENNLFHSDVRFKILVEDPISNNTFSGLDKVWYEVNSEQIMIYERQKEEKERCHTFNEEIVISSEKYNTNSIRLKVYAKDCAGNIYVNDEYEKHPFSIDITPPLIEKVEWNSENVIHGHYYNRTRIAKIFIRERNFDPNNVEFNMITSTGKMPGISSWYMEKSETDQSLNVCTVVFKEDGDYSMKIQCKDLAGWSSEPFDVKEFTVDQTPPEIQMEFDQSTPLNGKYYNKPRTAFIKINEHNFNPKNVHIEITSNEEIEITDNWIQEDDLYCKNILFKNDGVYSMVIHCEDLAGNRCDVVNIEEFIIDQTEPEIEFLNVKEGSANRGNIAPAIRLSDKNMNPDDLFIMYYGVKHEKKQVSGIKKIDEQTYYVNMEDFPHEKSMDDVYTMDVYAGDLAGNIQKEELTFSVNRFGSNYILDEETKFYLDRFYNNTELNLKIREINVDSIQEHKILCAKGDEIRELVQGKDYEIIKTGDAKSWHCYDYTIYKENFKDEGMYNLTLLSVDRANNQMTNKITDHEIKFVIDKTPPSVVFTNIQNEGQYQENKKEIQFVTMDDIAIKQVELYIDDGEVPVKTYDQNEIIKSQGKLNYSLIGASNWQKLKVIAIDQAGNILDTSKKDGWIRVLITSNPFVQIYKNKKLMTGVMASILVLNVIICLKKKKSFNSN